jgi:DNA polymerase-3 subunit delta'
MSDETIRGQGEALALIHAALKTGHVGHAYLFHGPAGVGKTRAALEFARAVLCERPAADKAACGTCPSCVAALVLRHPDLELIVPLPTFRTEGRTERQADEARSEARARIRERYAKEPWFLPVFSRPVVHSVEDLARAKEFLSLTAQRDGGWKALIVKGAEAMTGPAAHAFLKILEEPHPKRLLILGARQQRALLPTIASRCLPVRFRPLPAAAIVEALQQGYGIAPKTARLAAATAQGSLTRAAAPFVPPMDAPGKETFDEADFARLRDTAVELFVHPKTSAVLGPLRRARLERDRGRFLTAVALATHYYRDVIRSQVEGPDVEPAHLDLKKEILADARALPLQALATRVRILEEIAAAVQSNVTAAYAVGSAQQRMGLFERAAHPDS